jgi:hypothetical protein
MRPPKPPMHPGARHGVTHEIPDADLTPVPFPA